MSEALMGEPLYETSTVLKSEFDSESKKWEFRYETQDRRMKDMAELISELRKTIRGLKKQING